MSTDEGHVPTTECRVCRTDVPAGEYCGLCGAHLAPRRGEGPDWLRMLTYGAAPGEHLLQLSLASSLFPNLPPRSRAVFRIGLAVVLAALVAFALLRLPAALVTVAALGLLFLFLLYLRESEAFADIPARTWALTGVLGIGLGVGWVLLTGAMAYQLIAGVGVVPLGEPCELLCVDCAGKPVLLCELSVPFAHDAVALLPIVLLGGSELFGVIRLRLLGVERFRDGQHGGLCTVEMKTGLCELFVFVQLVILYGVLRSIGIGARGKLFLGRLIGLVFKLRGASGFRLRVLI